MSIKFFENFGGYTAAQATRVWNSIDIGTVTPTITQTGGRFNDSFASPGGSSNSSSFFSLTVTASATFVLGLALKITASPVLNAGGILSLVDGATLQCDLRINVDGTLSVTRNGSALTNGTSVNALSSGVWYYIEWKVTIADSIGANTCQVNVNGVNWITVATGQDVKNTSNASATQIRIGKTVQASSSGLWDWSHFYYDDGTAFLGDVRVENLAVAGDGATQNFTSSSGTHHNDVDDGTPDDNATYVESATPGDVELFTFSDLSTTPASILAVATFNCIAKTDAGSRVCVPVLRSGGVNYDQGTFPCVDSFKYDVQVIDEDPDTSAAWTPSGVNALEAGVKVVS
jgi:hypothetical protein